LTRGSGWVAGLWAALAFLSGGWPPLIAIALAVVVIGRAGSSFSIGLLVPPLIAAAVWSAATIQFASVELWAAALALPLTQPPAWSMGPGVLMWGLPWGPFSLLVLSRSLRAEWPEDGRRWVIGWLQAGLASLIAGTLVPGLGPPAQIIVLAGMLVVAAACLGSAWDHALGQAAARRVFFLLFAAVLFLWLVVVSYGCFIWNLTMPYYRGLGIVISLVVLVAIGLGWSALGAGNPRRAIVTVIVLAIGLKLAHWGYYVPEWNYRRSQGPWGRAIGQWVPRKWSVYTLHDWPDDLAFFIGRPVRQLRSARFLNYLPGSQSRYVLLLPQELENWPDHAPPISPVARFHDQAGGERILARTAGLLPVPGQSAPRFAP
jgi:hypothetical protein